MFAPQSVCVPVIRCHNRLTLFVRGYNAFPVWRTWISRPCAAVRTVARFSMLASANVARHRSPIDQLLLVRRGFRRTSWAPAADLNRHCCAPYNAV